VVAPAQCGLSPALSWGSRSVLSFALSFAAGFARSTVTQLIQSPCAWEPHPEILDRTFCIGFLEHEYSNYKLTLDNETLIRCPND
jgi:hypothetical protein